MTKIDASLWLQQARRRLSSVSDRPLSEAQILIGEVLGLPRAQVNAHPELFLTVSQIERLETLLSRRIEGEPLPYVLGHWEFYGLDFVVTPQVLIPRPETELLVENAILWLAQHPGRRLAADVGCGSGCIAITVAVHCPDVSMVMSDRSGAALAIARQNSLLHHTASRLHPVQSDLLTALRGPFDLVCANLPYIPANQLASLPVARYEPRLALDGGPRGMDLIERLLLDAPRWLAAGGLMLLEIEANQGEVVTKMAARLLPAAGVQLVHDLAGHPRLVMIQTDLREE